MTSFKKLNFWEKAQKMIKTFQFILKMNLQNLDRKISPAQSEKLPCHKISKTVIKKLYDFPISFTTKYLILFLEILIKST